MLGESEIPQSASEVAAGLAVVAALQPGSLGMVLLEGSAAAPVAAAPVAGAAVAPQPGGGVSMSQLAGLDIDPALKQFTWAMVTELQATKKEEKQLREVQFNQLTKDKETLENKTQNVEQANLLLVVKVQGLERAFSSRLDQCEAETSTFVQEMEHRRLQEADQCNGAGMHDMLVACCPGGAAGHRRALQGEQGCAGFPDTCSAECAPLLIAYYEGCQEVIIALAPAEKQDFDAFYTACTEAAQQLAAALAGATAAMIFHVVVTRRPRSKRRWPTAVHQARISAR